jgi:outer membrane immunogenic protein
MRRVCLSIAAVMMLAAPAAAADLPVKAAPMVPPAPVFSWTGFYLGINGGWGWARDGRDDRNGGYWSPAGGGSHSLRLDGGLFGGQIGYNWQFGGNWVFGLEAMGDAAWLERTDDNVFGLNGSHWRGRTEAIFLGTGRLGYAFGNWLPYVKGGYAGSSVKADVWDGTFSNSNTAWRHGWTVGGGVEYAVTNNWIIGLEYDHMEFERTDWNGPRVSDAFRDSLKVDAVLGRLSYKFF